ncbi:glycosyltransferase [Candidatus Bathyarchaeota archaeon]|nr:glycosyltransferase [Candidatus Bathyarchaeota archaeon]
MTLAKSFAHDTRPRLEALALGRGGYDVEVLAWDRDLRMPFKAMVDGTRTTNVRIFRGVEFRKLKFALASIIFQMACFFYALRLCCVGRLLIHAHDFNTLLPSAMIKLVFRDRIRLVYDSHEYTPGVYTEWYGYVTGRVAGVLERIFGRCADAVITVSDPIADYLERTLGQACTVLWNCPPLKDIPATSREVARAKLNLPTGFLILCMGLFRQDLLFEVLSELRESAPTDGMNDVRAVLVGKGLPEEFLAKTAANPEFFIVRDWVERETALLYYRACDLTYCMYRTDGANSKIGMPWKLFESVLCGTPVLVTRGSYSHMFVQKYKCGAWADPRSASDLLEAISKIRDAKGTALTDPANEFAKIFSWETMRRRLLTVYEGLEKERKRKKSKRDSRQL